MENFNITNIAHWDLSLQMDKPIIISGPCSAETEAQLIETAIQVAKNGAHILRAGIWKPRTRPNSFEGVGEIGLPWLKKASQITGLPVCVEVANAKHVKLALAHKIDILWIGARTTVNPFAVQEIADALRGVDIPVMVKNPINPDVGLWIGAIERLQQAGIHKIAAIHRGFSIYNAKPYRNAPQWEIPIELRRQCRGLEIICDPSHICGNRELIPGIVQYALDLNFDGLMIEAHINPKEAWSDAQQQVTPEVLGDILRNTQIKNSTILDPLLAHKLKQLRKEIDQIDNELLNILAQRLDIVRKIGEYKLENDVTILQIDRWDEIFKTRINKSNPLNLSKTFVQNIIQEIHKESIRQQTTIKVNSILKANS